MATKDLGLSDPKKSFEFDTVERGYISHALDLLHASLSRSAKSERDPAVAEMRRKSASDIVVLLTKFR